MDLLEETVIESKRKMENQRGMKMDINEIPNTIERKFASASAGKVFVAVESNLKSICFGYAQ